VIRLLLLLLLLLALLLNVCFLYTLLGHVVVRVHVVREFHVV
jgi:hypothetical protein